MSEDQFKTRLKIAKNKAKSNDSSKNDDSRSGLGVAFKMSTELVSAVAVGTIIGFILDNWFDTKPWLILIFFFIGVITGIMNVVRSAKKMQR
jgi:ATP synthase protein I